MDKQPVKIIYFLSHPIQYFSPLVKELAATVELEVYYFSGANSGGRLDKGFGEVVSWDTPLLEGYSSFFLKNYRKDRGLNNKFWDVWNPGAWNTVRRSEADIVVLNGWSYSSCWVVLLAAALYGKKVWLRAENPLNQELKKGRAKLLIKKILLKYFLFRCLVDKCLYIGTQSKSFFTYYGVAGNRLIYTPYSVDNGYFQSAWLENKDRLPEISKGLGLPAGRKFVLFSGKFIPKKRPLDLLLAFASLDPDKYFLLMVGEGVLRPKLEDFIRKRNMQNVKLTGFINQSAIPLYYSVADLLVMCSGLGETWGLSVNEAMNFAKPVVVSNTCGCSSDLVNHGVNGYVFEEGNIGQLEYYLRKVLEDDAFRREAGEKSQEMIGEFSVNRIVQNITEAG